MKIVIESLQKLTDEGLEAIIGIWTRKARSTFSWLCTQLFGVDKGIRLSIIEPQEVRTRCSWT